MTIASVSVCRLCAAEVSEQFRLEVDRVGSVGYSRCVRCQALQSEAPTWLAELYRSASWSHDWRAAQRAVTYQRLLPVLLALSGVDPVRGLLDFGGGDGLQTRMFRDVGLDAAWFDCYRENLYADGFAGDPKDDYTVVTAFEVIEHLPEPAETMATLFSMQPDMLLVSTELFCGQGADWYYLTPATGEHVFFWSEQSMRWLAETYGYQVIATAFRTLFLRRPVGSIRTLALRAALRWSDRWWLRGLGDLLGRRPMHDAPRS